MLKEQSSMLGPEIDAGPSVSVPFTSRYLRFGSLQVDQHRQEVTKSGVRLKLERKVYQVLVALIEKQGEVVTREELRARLWPVEAQVNYDANVNSAVSKLRRAIGDFFIETVPRKGYCLAAPPENSFVSARNPAVPKSNIRIVLGVIALILAGMLLGVGVTLWSHHFALRLGGLWP